MASNKGSTPASKNGVGAAQLIVHAQAPAVANGAAKAVLTTTVAPASIGTASTGTGSNTPTGGVLASLGVKSSGFTQVKVKSVSNAAFQRKLGARLNGAEGYLPADSSFSINGQTFTAASIVSILEAILALFSAKTSAQTDAKAMVATTVAALNNELPAASQFVNGLDGVLVSFFGKGNPVLENFGLSKGVAKASTTLEKAEAVGTMKLTREARHTMGKVQKAGVNGGTATLALTGPGGKVIAGSLPAAAPTTAPAPAAGSTGNTSGQ
jgi:hypothetical protein